MTGDLVSIITPVYNAERFVADTVRSVLAQTYSHWELWLVNDASTDGSLQLISAFSKHDSRIHIINLHTNSGAAVARNTAIRKAAGRYIAFLDADDLWDANKLEKQISFMQQTQCALSYTAYRVMNDTGNLTGRVIHCPPTLTYRQLLIENRIGCLTAIMDTQQTGIMEMPFIHKRQDYGLWLNILKKGFCAQGIDTPLATYRKYATSLSGNKWKTIGYNWELLRKYQGLSFLQAAWFFFLFLLNKTVMAVLRKAFNRDQQNR